MQILRYADVGDPAGRSTTLPELCNSVSRTIECNWAELVDAMKRLHAEGLLGLLKWINHTRIEYEGRENDEEFFYRADFRLLITPQGRTYYEALLAQAEADEPRPKRPIGFFLFV